MEQNEKKKKIPAVFIVLMIIGPVLFVVGIVFVVMGANVKFDITYQIPVGAVLMFFGIVCSIFGYLPLIQKAQIKASRYIIEGNKEDIKVIADTSADATKGAVKTVARSVKEGLKNETKYCKYCGTEIDANSIYCNKCGQKQ